MITDGDAGYFAGLSELRRSETLGDEKARKRVIVAPKRLYHNGPIKRPAKDPATGKSHSDTAMFGSTVKQDGPLQQTGRDAPTRSII
ncbi:MAG: hypothetical protein QOJ80_3888 [Mycobacterium sp.]|nr:hypothetical protein [Mycobacterium sp.]